MENYLGHLYQVGYFGLGIRESLWVFNNLFTTIFFKNQEEYISNTIIWKQYKKKTYNSTNRSIIWEEVLQ